jgi:hypothetical protein
MSLQSCAIHNSTILKLLVGDLEEKCHLDVAFVGSYRIYYKEENGDSS